MTFVSLQLLSLKVKSSKEFSPPSSSSFPFSFFGQKEKWAFFWADDSLRSCYLHLGLYFLLGRGIWNVCWLEKMRRAAKFLSFSSSEDVAAVESVFLGSCYAFSNIEGRDNCFWFEIHTEREITQKCLLQCFKLTFVIKGIFQFSEDEILNKVTKKHG